jgi:hypothetical protein
MIRDLLDFTEQVIGPSQTVETQAAPVRRSHSLSGARAERASARVIWRVALLAPSLRVID